MIVQHLDGEAVVAVGGLLTDVKCLMLSKVLTWLANSGGSKQEGCRGCGKDALYFLGNLRSLSQDSLARCPTFLPWHNCCIFPNCFGEG